MKALDLFCGGGGAARGLIAAGYEVVGVDLYRSPAYPGPVLVGDAMDIRAGDLAGFDLVWASPPCQRYSQATPERSRSKHPDLLEAIQDLLGTWGGLSIVENVMRAPLAAPQDGCLVTISGPQVGLHLIERKRQFACSGFVPMIAPRAPLRRRAGAVTVLRQGARTWNRSAGKRVAGAAVLIGRHGATAMLGEPGSKKRTGYIAAALSVVTGGCFATDGKGGSHGGYGALKAGEYWLVGRELHGAGVLRGKALMRACLGIEDETMSQAELGEAIPPAYALVLAEQARRTRETA